MISHYVRIANVQTLRHIKIFSQILALEVLHAVFKDCVRYAHVPALNEHVAQAHAKLIGLDNIQL